MSQRLQAPVYYAVQTSPTRAGSYPGPYTIINFSADGGTVWVADNAGLQPGQGTPIYPGTSLRWDKSGDLWVVGENDTTQVIISYDVGEWQPNPAAIAAAVLNSGVLLIDQPEVIYNANVTGPGTTPRIDISRYQSISINLTCTGLAPGTQDMVTVAYYYTDDPAEASFTGKTIQLASAAGSPGRWWATIPVYGSHLALFVYAATSFTVNIVGSHRPQELIDQTILSPNGDYEATSFYNAGIVIPQPGVAPDITLPPWFGEIELTAFGGWASALGAAKQSAIRLMSQDAAGAYRIVMSWEIENSALFGSSLSARCYARFASAGESLVLSVLNNTTSGGNLSLNVRVVPVTGYGGK